MFYKKNPHPNNDCSDGDFFYGNKTFTKKSITQTDHIFTTQKEKNKI